MVDTLFSIEEVAKILGVCKLTVCKKIKSGKLKAFKDGTFMRVYELDLKAYLKAHYNIKDNVFEKDN